MRSFLFAVFMVGMLLPAGLAVQTKESQTKKPTLRRLWVRDESGGRNQCYAEWSTPVSLEHAQKEMEKLANLIIGTETKFGSVKLVEVKPLTVKVKDGEGRFYEVLSYFREGGSPYSGAHFAQLIRHDDGSYWVTFAVNETPLALDFNRLREAIKHLTGAKEVKHEITTDKYKRVRYTVVK